MIIIKHLVIWAICLFALGEAGIHASHALAIGVWLAGGIATGLYAQHRLEQCRIAAHAHLIYQDEQIRMEAHND